MKLALEKIGSITDWRNGDTWPAARIASHASARAAMLRTHGAAPGTRVIISYGGSPAFFADLFGVWQAGACAVCLNPASAAAELETIINFVEPVAVLEKAEELAEESLQSESAAPEGELDDDALILFTSGTTGIPKGVVHTFRSILSRVALNQAHIPAVAMRRTLCVLPTYFGHGLIGNCLTPLLAGHDLVLAPAANLEVTAKLGEIIDDYGITFMSSVPTLWKKVAKMATPPRSGSLARVQVGSAPLSAMLWNEIADWSRVRDVVNMYGITETANWLCGASLADHDARDGLIGLMWGGMARVMTPSSEVNNAGEGEILVQSPSLMKGYYRQPDATADVLRDGWFHTGDIGEIDTNGVMRLTGRAKHEINRGGLKIHPEDIDLLLERHEGVHEVCTFPIPDENEGETVGVAVSLRNGINIDAQALRSWCAERISREKVPVRWVILDEIPKTDRGKINRATVAAHCLNPGATT